MTDKPMLILIAGPYRSGTSGDPQAMAANLARLEAAAWPVFEAGHLPVIGEWGALPVPTGADQDVATRPPPRPARLPLRGRDPAPRPAGDRVNPRPGIDTPDHRGRTGLDQAGRHLDRNPDIVVRDVELTSQGWHVLRRSTFDHRRRDGRWVTQQRETYDRGDGAVVLPYDAEQVCCSPVSSGTRPTSTTTRTACSSRPQPGCSTATTRESAEELGVTLGPLTHILDAYMSPGSVTERLHFYAAPYTPADRTGTGGGLEEDGEDIEVLELPFLDALAMVRDGRITDGKTILLLQWAALDGPFAPAAGTG